MGVIYNATNEEQTIRALGNWFTLKPKQIKILTDNLANWIAEQKKEHGLVALSAQFEDPEHKNTPEGKQELEMAEEAGIQSYLDYHRMIIANNQVSLRRDLEQANIKADPAVFATQGEINSMKIVEKYNRANEDASQQRAEEVKELMKKIKETSK